VPLARSGYWLSITFDTELARTASNDTGFGRFDGRRGGNQGGCLARMVFGLRVDNGALEGEVDAYGKT
jgi:hypothetical protein